MGGNRVKGMLSGEKIQNIQMGNNGLQDRLLGEKIQNIITGYSFLLPAMVLLTLFLFLPFILTIYYGFTDYYLLKPEEKQFIGLANYATLLKDELFLKTIKNTFYFVFLVVPLQMGTGLGLALLANMKLKGTKFYRAAYFSPTVISMVVVSILWSLIYSPNNGLINQFLQAIGLSPQPFLSSPNQAMNSIIAMSAWQGAGNQMMLFLAGLQDIPEHLYEAAKIDGANKWQRFVHVTLPGLKNVLIFVTITITIAAFKLFVQPMVMTQGGPLDSTKTIILQLYEVGYKFKNMGYGCAMGVGFIILVLFIAYVQKKAIPDTDET